MNEYAQIAASLEPRLLEVATRQLKKEGFFSMSLESKLAFIQGLKFGSVIAIKPSPAQLR